MSILPTEKSVPKEKLSDYLLMIYGKPGIGKTTLAAQFEDPMFIMFEPGAKSLSVYRKEITKWEIFQSISEELSEDKKRFRTIVIDTTAPAYDLCQQYMSKLHGVKHISDVPYKGWDMLRAEFTKQIRRISLSGRGVVLLSHSTDKDIERFDGTVKTMVAPNLSKQAMQFMNEVVDVLAYYYYAEDGSRWIRLVDNGECMAKNRIKGHFNGIKKFEAGNNEEETYQKFIAAFENKIGGEKHEAYDSRNIKRVFQFGKK